MTVYAICVEPDLYDCWRIYFRFQKNQCVDKIVLLKYKQIWLYCEAMEQKVKQNQTKSTTIFVYLIKGMHWDFAGAIFHTTTTRKQLQTGVTSKFITSFIDNSI